LGLYDGLSCYDYSDVSKSNLEEINIYEVKLGSKKGHQKAYKNLSERELKIYAEELRVYRRKLQDQEVHNVSQNQPLNNIHHTNLYKHINQQKNKLTITHKHILDKNDNKNILTNLFIEYNKQITYHNKIFILLNPKN
jgi:hypothetical protein